MNTRTVIRFKSNRKKIVLVREMWFSFFHIHALPVMPLVYQRMETIKVQFQQYCNVCTLLTLFQTIRSHGSDFILIKICVRRKKSHFNSINSKRFLKDSMKCREQMSEIIIGKCQNERRIRIII